MLDPRTENFFHILALTIQSGGLGWEVQMGRKDSLTASKESANNNIPGPNSDVATLAAKFQNVGLTLDDVVTLSGNFVSPYCH